MIEMILQLYNQFVAPLLLSLDAVSNGFLSKEITILQGNFTMLEIINFVFLVCILLFIVWFLWWVIKTIFKNIFKFVRGDF